jgi:hypothetical protein
MILKALVLEAKDEKKTFKKGTYNVFLIVVSDVQYPSRTYDLIIFDSKQKETAKEEIQKGMEVMFKLKEIKGNGYGSFNQYATPDEWKITKDLKGIIEELQGKLEQ